MSKRTNMTIGFNNDQMDLFDFVLNFKYNNMGRTTFLLMKIREEIYDFIGLPPEMNLPDSQLSQMAIDKQKENIISIVGQENYDKLLKESEEK